MKKWVLFVSAAFGMYTVTGQKLRDQAVPAPVKAGLSKQYPAAKQVRWEKEKDRYEAGFAQGGSQYSVLLDAKGHIVETELEIAVEALPQSVRAYVAKNYPGHKIKEAAQITDAKGAITYEAEVKGKDLLFDPSGKRIGQQ